MSTHNRLTRHGFRAGFILAAVAALWSFATRSSEARPAPTPSPQVSAEHSSWQQLPDMPVPRWESGRSGTEGHAPSHDPPSHVVTLSQPLSQPIHPGTDLATAPPKNLGVHGICQVGHSFAHPQLRLL